jgi:hypothetical protein
MNPRKKRMVLGLLILIVALSVAAGQFVRLRNAPIVSDEAAWIFSTVFWKHYSSGDFSNSDWKNLDAIDHPPLAKYYYGAVLDLQEMVEPTIEAKNWWLSESGDYSKGPEFTTGMNERVSKERLQLARTAASFLFVFAALGVYILASTIAGSWTGALAALLFIGNGVVNGLAPYVFTDFLLIGLVAFGSASIFIWLKSWCNAAAGQVARKSWFFALLSGVLIGLAILAKFNGIIQFGLLAVALGLALLFCAKRRGLIVAQAAVAVIIACVVVVALDPTALHTPLSMITAILFRTTELANDEIMSGLSGVSVYSRFAFAFQTLFFEHGLPLDKIYLPIGLLLTITGLLFTIPRLSRTETKPTTRATAWFVILAALMWALPTIWSFKFTLYQRYLLPIVPWMSLAMAYGITSIYAWMRKLSSDGWSLVKPQTKTIAGAIVIFILCWSALASVNIRAEYTLALNRPSFRATRLRALLMRHPAQVDARLELAQLYLEMNEKRLAAQEIGKTLAIEPNNKLARALLEILKEQLKTQSK